MSSLIVSEVVTMRGISGFQILDLVLIFFCPEQGYIEELFSLFGSSCFREGKCRRRMFLFLSGTGCLAEAAERDCWETRNRADQVVCFTGMEPVAVLGRSLFLRFAGGTVTPQSM